MDIDALIASAKLPEETVPVCLRPDLRTRWEQLDAELTQERLARNTLAPTNRERELAADVKALEAEIGEHTLQLQLRALKHEPWSKLLAEHPPRKDNLGDQSLGVNADTFVPAMILAQLVEPQLTPEQFERLLDVLTDRQYENLQTAAWSLSRADRNRPVFSLAASLIPDSGETPRQQSDSGSAPRASRAKNRKS